MIRRVLFLALMLACARDVRAQTTAFFFSAQPGAPLAGGQQATITPANATFQPTSSLGISISFSIDGPAINDELQFTANPNNDTPIAVGAYESARAGAPSITNGLYVSINGTACNTQTGRFVVLEIAYAQDGSLAQFAADFEQHCDAATPALFGAIRYNSTISDLTPFGGDYPVYSLQVSATHGTITGAGLSCGTGGSSCKVTLGTPAVVQLTAVPDPGYIFTGWIWDCIGQLTTSITVYGPRTCSATFDTAVPTSPRTIMFWKSAAGDPVGLGLSDTYSLQNSVWTAWAGNLQQGVTVDVEGITSTGAPVAWLLQFYAPSGSVLQAGTYTGATGPPFNPTTPGIDVSGIGEGCSTPQSGQFTVREIQFGPSGDIAKLAIDFEQRCGGQANPSAPPLTGSLEFHSMIDMPTVAIDKTQLAFGATMSGAAAFAAQSSAQAIRLTQTGSGTVTWTASSNSPWLVVSPMTGTGSATLNVSVKFDPSLSPPPARALGSVTITATGAINAVPPITVTLNTIASSSVQPPFGSFDTPTNLTTGVAGSIAVTGWALDAVQVTRVTVCRDPVPTEPAPANGNCAGNAQIYIGDAEFVDGARPDVQAGFPSLPLNSRGGWGYLMLTNFLPGFGNGTFNIRAYAYDAEGLTTALGVKTITCDNAHSTAPFGAIDTPGQGAVVSGAAYTNFGWVLAAPPNHADPPDGGTVNVFVDGINVGSPGGWSTRSDLQAGFPVSQYPDIVRALAVFGLDTTTLANGVHTIAWSVTGFPAGGTSGIGSRFFTVSNGAELVTPAAATSSSPVASVVASRATLDMPPPASARMASGPMLASEIAAAPLDLGAVAGRRGFDLDAPLRTYTPSSGAIDVQAEELDRIELRLSGSGRHQYTGYLQTPAGLRPLPVGSSLDASTGTFTWAPGAGFYGTYNLTFVRWSGANAVARQDVRITLNAKGSNRVGPQTIIDAPAERASVGSPFFIGGWAADLNSTVHTGVDTVHVWAYPVDTSGHHRDPIFLGPAIYGGARPDVAALYGDSFVNSGYGIIVDGLAPGTYDLAVFAFSTVVNNFTRASIVRVTVR